MLELRLLGQFEAQLDQRGLDIPTRPAQSLLAYLALNPGVEQRRERLAGLFWPESTDSNARGYLRHALWRIRKSIEEAGGDPDSYLQVSKISLALDPQQCWVDAVALAEPEATRGLSADTLTFLVSLYQGELLPGFHDEWTVAERERLLIVFEERAAQLVDRLSEDRRWRDVIRWGEHWIEHGLVPEAAYRAVMVAHAASGDRASAAAVYTRAAEALEAELGLEPSPELSAALQDATQAQIPDPMLKHLLVEAQQQLRGELRPVTSLFAGLYDLPPLTAEADLESRMELLDEATQAIVEVVLRFEGTVVRIQEDGVLAFFGAPLAHEDDANRALVAAQGIHALLKETMGDDHIQVHIGIDTGPVLVGELGWDLRLGYTAIGGPVTEAIRLSHLALAGGTLISSSTHDAAGPGFEFSPAQGPSDEKAAFALIGGAPVTHRRPDRWQVPLIGRKGELEQLNNALDEVRSGVGQAVFITGEAGVGKTRLIEELRAASPDTSWTMGNCLSYAESSPYHPIKGVIRDLAGIQVLDEAVTARRKLRSRLRSLDPLDLDWTLAGLQAVLSLPAEPYEATYASRQSPAEALVSLIRLHSHETPLVIVVDDLQWADRDSIDLLEHVLTRLGSQRALLLLVFRSDPKSEAWDLSRRTMATSTLVASKIDLGQLNDAEAGALLDALVPLATPVKDLVLSRSNGNPFFLGELVRSLIERKVLVRENGHWQAREADRELAVPDTVQKVILSRADRLPEAERWALWAASVLGWRFRASLLAQVAGQPVLDSLKVLTESHFIRLEGGQPEAGYVFVHWLIRDSIYGTMLKSDRKLLHRRASQALEPMLEERGAEVATLMTYHDVAAGETERALEHAILASETAWQTATWTESDQALRMALEQAPPPEVEIRLWLARARELFTAARVDESLKAYERIVDLAEEIGDRSMVASYLAYSAQVGWQTGNARTERWEFLESALERISKDPPSDGKVQLLHEAGRQYYAWGELQLAEEYLGQAQEGLPACVENPVAIASHVINSLGLLRLREGSFEEGLVLLHEARALAEESGEVVANSRATTNLASAMFEVFGDFKEGQDYAALSRAGAWWSSIWASTVEETVHLARLHWGEGRAQAGLAVVKSFTDRMRGSSPWMPVEGAQAPLLGMIGEAERSLRLATRAWRISQKTQDELPIRHAGLWMARALGYAGRLSEAARYLEVASAAAAGSPAMRAELLAEWIYADPRRRSAIKEQLAEVPELAPTITHWKDIGIALAVGEVDRLSEGANALERLGQPYPAWQFRHRAAVALKDNRLGKQAEDWAAERDLELY